MSRPCPVPSCTRTMPGHHTVCRACSAGLLRDLADVPSLDIHLDLTLTRQARLGTPGGGRGGETALPWDQRARDARDVLRSALVGWVRALQADEERSGPACRACEHPSCAWIDATRTPADTLPALARWLIRQRRGLFAHPAVEEAVDELGDAVRQARRAIDRPADRIYAGPCNECGADLLARLGAREVTCRPCAVVYDIEPRLEWMRRETEDLLGNASWVAAAARALGYQVTASQVRGMASRKTITARGRDAMGHPAYRVGDVIALIAERAAW